MLFGMQFYSYPILLGCPAPIPIVDLPFAKTIALDLTNLQILNANLRLAKLNWVMVFFL